jgi:hypothetical protein
MGLFEHWSDFYVIVGSSSAALIGLQFVVIVLSAEVRMGSAQTTSAFATPTIVHFCGVLLVSAIMTAPWPVPRDPAIALVLVGIAGVVYAVTIIHHARRQSDYKPVLEDWIWHNVLPVMAYLALAVAAMRLAAAPVAGLFVIGGAVVLLLFIGIHNAWDSVTYIAQESRRGRSAEKR